MTGDNRVTSDRMIGSQVTMVPTLSRTSHQESSCKILQQMGSASQERTRVGLDMGLVGWSWVGGSFSRSGNNKITYIKVYMYTGHRCTYVYTFTHISDEPTYWDDTQFVISVSIFLNMIYGTCIYTNT